MLQAPRSVLHMETSPDPSTETPFGNLDHYEKKTMGQAKFRYSTVLM